MRLLDYFKGYPVVMQSRLGRDEVERRINAATISRFALFEQGVVGRARGGRVRLRFKPKFRDYNMLPILAGRVDDRSGPSRLTLRFRAPGVAFLFFALWYAFILLFLGLWLAGEFTRPSTSGGERVVPPLLGLFFLLAPVATLGLGLRRMDAQFEFLVDFVERTAEAEVIGGHRRGPERVRAGAR